VKSIALIAILAGCYPDMWTETHACIRWVDAHEPLICRDCSYYIKAYFVKRECCTGPRWVKRCAERAE
jgi:hypothetical protein